METDVISNAKGDGLGYVFKWNKESSCQYYYSSDGCEIQPSSHNR